MKEWLALYEQHCTMRTDSIDLESSLRRRLIELADRGHCAKTLRGRFTHRHPDPRSIPAGPRTPDSRLSHTLHELYIRGGPEPLRELHGLQDARLTLQALISRRTERVHHFTAMIEGMTAKRLTWVAAVHLEDDHEPSDHDRKGDGACSHAAFHCHVGPTMNDDPKVRVPFPSVGPVGALDWLLSIVVPGWEPAPWPQVVSLP